MALTLQKQTINLVIDQGCTFERLIYAQNSSGSNVSVGEGTVTGKMRQSYHSANNVFTFGINQAGSNVTISLTASQTANLLSDRQYLYDVEYTQSDGTTVERVAEGIITINPEATK